MNDDAGEWPDALSPIYLRGSSSKQADPQDLEALVTLLEVAALSLTRRSGDTFTAEQLIAEAREFCGKDFAAQDRDFLIALKGMTMLTKQGSFYCVK